jgi:hypothetical protein
MDIFGNFWRLLNIFFIGFFANFQKLLNILLKDIFEKFNKFPLLFNICENSCIRFNNGLITCHEIVRKNKAI